ncbi:MAG: fibronectin type III domain-containing protein, partial [Lachnospiraceae bacterium]|nr:fibronectin type III domain-containing protein [Lachnospiraceae bacterium]
MEHLNLSLTLNENGSVTAVWTPVSGADRYHVALRGLYDDFLLEREDNLTATSFTSREGLEANRQYVVRVQAYSGSAHLVTESKQILVDSDFYNKTPLSVPGNVTAEATSTTVTVRFDAVDRATRYDILLGDREEEVTGTSKSFYNLEPKTTYLYRVRAKNNSKTGAYSPVQYITTRPEPPAQPRNIKGSATENTVTVSWEAVGRAAGYELLFNGASYKTKNTVYTVSGLEKGTGYSYKVRAYTAEAEGAWSRESTITTIPGIPSNITAEATANSVLVRWDEVKGATFYKRRFGDLDGNEVIVPGRDSKITGLTPGTTYHYQICAFNNSGEGRYSPVKSITTLRQTLGTPVIRLKKTTDNSATVGWAAVMGATEYEVSCNGSVRSTTDTAMTIPDLKAATDYSIRVRAKSTAGGSFYSEPVTVTTAPKPPVGIRAESTDTKVTISWEAAEGATGYLVRFNQTDIPAAGTTATFSNLTADTAYSYQVCAKGIHGNGSFSREQTVRTLAAAPEVPEGPAAPTNIRKSVSGNTAAFSWNPVSGATGYTIKFNNAQYQQASVSREFTGLEAGTDYSFQVRAENAAGSGAWSASVTAAVPPAPPVNIRAVSTKDSVTISWDAVPKAAGYQVRWGTGTVDTIASSYTFQGLQADEEYTYQVCCKSRDGIGSYSGEQRIRTKEVQLSVPVILTKTATDTSVQVSWGAVAGAACYDVRLMTSTGIVDSGRVTANTITFTGLRADLPYSVQVCARNGNSTSADSSAVTVRTAPTPPSDIRTSAGVDCIYISWTAVRGAKGYILQCGQKEEMTDADTTRFTFTDLTPDTEYSCKICCRGADGVGSYSLPQLVSTSKNPQGAPDVPAGVRAAAFGNSVTVSWNAVAGADSYFLIFNGEIIRVSGTSYTVSSLSPGTTYPYQVCSVKGEKQSAYTVKKVTTAPAAPGNITAEYSAAQAVIRWEAVPDAAAYRVCCGTEERLVQGGTLSCIFSGLRPGTQYMYKVCSINKHGTGSYSRERSFSTPETAPDIPVILRKTVSGRKAEIVWETVEKASYYNIRLVSDTGKEYIDMRAGRTWSAELAEGHSYSAQVRACGRTGCSAYSAAVSMVMPPAPPSGIAAEGTEHSITVSWSPAEDAAGYVVRCGSQEKTAGADMTAVSFTGLVSGTEYSYQICAVSADGRGVFSGKQTFSTPRSQEGVLPAPTNVGFQVSQEFLSISWDWVKGATGYQVLLNSSTYTIPADENEIVLIIKPNKEYSIRVRAVNRLIGGDYSTKLDITSPPASPRGLTLETSETDVTVSWEAVENATGYTVLMNNVRYPVDSGETTSITIPLEPGTQFDCKVMSRNLFGESVYPANGSGWTTLRPPVGIRAVADDASVTISWEEVAGATGYEVSLGDQIHMVEGGRTSFTAADLAPGAYTYTVRTRNRGGLGSPSEAGRIGFRMPPPGVPEHVYAMVLSDTVKIEWSSVEGALGYHVLFDGDNYETPLPCKVFTGLAPNTYYSYAVRAYNEGGPGEYSPAQEALTLPALPEAPGDVRAFPASAHSIEISWSPVTAADSYQVRVGDKVYEASDSPFVAENLEQNTVYTYAVRSGNSMGFSNYSKEGSVRTMLAAPGNIRASAGETSVTLRWDPVPGAEAYEVKLGKRNHETTETELEIPGLSENTLYTYTLRVKNGMEYGEYSPKGQIKTLFSLAHRSLNVTAEAASGSVLVSWDDVNEAEHYELEFDGIVIQRKGANSPYAAGAASEAAAPMVRSLAAEAGKTGQARIYHTIAGLKPNTTHKYRVRAGNAGGYGPYSALQSITTCISQRRGLPDMAQDRVYPDGRPAHLGLDPVNPLTGSFLWSHTCLEDSGKDRLHFTLLYDSQRGDDGKLLGRGWSHALHYQLSMDEAYAYFHTPRGEVIPFGRDGEGGGFHPVEETAFGYTMAAGGEGAFEVTDPDGMVYVFGSSLILCEMRQWGETIFRFRADEGGRIKEIRGRYGAALLLAYEGDCIAAVSNTAGERLSLLYQEGSLTMLRLPGDSSVSFGYDGAGRLAQLKDALGKVWLTNEYDGPGRVIRQHAAGRGASTASYDTENRTTAFTDPSGNTTLYRYDEKGCITEVWLEGSSIRRSYNERGQVTEETDALGSVTQMGYDGKGRMNRLTHPDGSTETVTYNERNQPAEVVGRDGTRTLYGYDEKGRLASIRDGRGNVC